MRAYNPLSVEEIGRNAARALMAYPADVLPPVEAFQGAGVYTLHYAGLSPAYAGIGEDAPIYVGKADSPGRRQGRTSASSQVLHSRLQEHAESIEAATNLDLPDFRCRWLVLDPVWIGLTEQVLIAQYQPIMERGRLGLWQSRSRRRPPESAPFPDGTRCTQAANGHLIFETGSRKRQK